MNVIHHSVASDYMKCILSYLKDILDQPAPFRLQPHMAFTIAYDEYLKFLSDSSYKNLKLVTDDETIQRYAASQQSRLYSCFLKDIAFGINKELYYAVNRGQKGTIVLPVETKNPAHSYSCDQFITVIGDTSNEAKIMADLLKSQNFKFTIPSEGHNFKLYRLSLALLKYAENYKEGDELLSILWV